MRSVVIALGLGFLRNDVLWRPIVRSRRASRTERSNARITILTAEHPAAGDPTRRKSDTKVALMCVASAVAMGGMAYAAVPLYQMFCQVTGLGGTTQKAEKAVRTRA